MELWELVKLVSERYGQRLQEHQSLHPYASELQKVSVQQYQYLQVISRMDGATIGSLATYFKVRAPSATALVSRLEEQGLVKRHSDPQDGRVQRITLSKKGMRILSVQESAFRDLAKEIAEALAPGELNVYEKLTLKVCEAFGEKSKS